jgi:hypothetical protein
MNDRDFNAIVESRLEAAVEESIHDIRAEVTSDLCELYEQEFKEATGRHASDGEEGFGELDGDGEWTEALVEASQEVGLLMQGEFNLRVREAIRDFKTDHVEEIREALREELRTGVAE